MNAQSTGILSLLASLHPERLKRRKARGCWLRLSLIWSTAEPPASSGMRINPMCNTGNPTKYFKGPVFDARQLRVCLAGSAGGAAAAVRGGAMRCLPRQEGGARLGCSRSCFAGEEPGGHSDSPELLPLFLKPSSATGNEIAGCGQLWSSGRWVGGAALCEGGRQRAPARGGDEEVRLGEGPGGEAAVRLRERRGQTPANLRPPRSLPGGAVSPLPGRTEWVSSGLPTPLPAGAVPPPCSPSPLSAGRIPQRVSSAVRAASLLLWSNNFAWARLFSRVGRKRLGSAAPPPFICHSLARQRGGGGGRGRSLRGAEERSPRSPGPRGGIFRSSLS